MLTWLDERALAL